MLARKEASLVLGGQGKTRVAVDNYWLLCLQGTHGVKGLVLIGPARKSVQSNPRQETIVLDPVERN